MPHHVSIVIRTFNEQKWIRHCLVSVFSQKFSSFDVVIVDSKSSDNTLRICAEFPIRKFITIEDYRPGDALNKGIECNQADFYVCLSAHCIPCNEFWLANLLEPFSNTNIVGVYGRQLPLPSSLNIDKRDLLMTFSCESRHTTKDGFFHNANSALRHSYVINNPFDANVTNAEDHVWGRNVILNNHSLFYSAESAVFHHHGLHQGSPPKRVNGVLGQLEQCIDQSLIYFPDSLTPKGSLCYALILINLEEHELDTVHNNLNMMLSQSNVFSKYIFISSIPTSRMSNYFHNLSENSFFFFRGDLNTPLDANLWDLLQEVSTNLHDHLAIPDHYVFINAAYINITSDHINNIYSQHLCSNFDSTYAGIQCYDCIVARDSGGDYMPVSNDMLKPRSARDPLYRICYGLGSVFNAYFFNDPHSSTLKFGIHSLLNSNLTFKKF